MTSTNDVTYKQNTPKKVHRKPFMTEFYCISELNLTINEVT